MLGDQVALQGVGRSLAPSLAEDAVLNVLDGIQGPQSLAQLPGLVEDVSLVPVTDDPEAHGLGDRAVLEDRDPDIGLATDRQLVHEVGSVRPLFASGRTFFNHKTIMTQNRPIVKSQIF